MCSRAARGAVLVGLLSRCHGFLWPARASVGSQQTPLTQLHSSSGYQDDDADVRYSMSRKHIDTGFLKREKAAPLYEDPSKLSAEALNEIFQPDEKENLFLLRSMWTASCIFRLDGILADTADMHSRIWEQVADSFNAPSPSSNQVFNAMHVPPEEAVTKVFNWANDPDEAKAMASTFDEVAISVFNTTELYPIGGASELVEDMIESEIPSAVFSNLPLEAIETALTKIGLREMIECVETYDGRLKTEGQLLLNACLELERPPRHAVVFDFSAQGVDVAHDNDMRAVVLDGLYYQELEVNQCDAKLNKLTDWTLPRFRQLIERFPFDEQYATVTARAPMRTPNKRKTAVAMYDVFRYEKLPDGTVAPTQEYLALEQKRRVARERAREDGSSLPEGSRFFNPKKGGEDDDDLGDAER